MTALRFALAAALVAGFAAPRAASAQIPGAGKIVYACYVPSSGTVYRIKTADTPAACVKDTHKAFSWYEKSPAGVAGYETVTQTTPAFGAKVGYKALVYCPVGKVPLAIGYELASAGVLQLLSMRPLPAKFGTGPGWRITVMNVGSVAASYTAYLTCATAA